MHTLEICLYYELAHKRGIDYEMKSQQRFEVVNLYLITREITEIVNLD